MCCPLFAGTQLGRRHKQVIILTPFFFNGGFEAYIARIYPVSGDSDIRIKSLAYTEISLEGGASGATTMVLGVLFVPPEVMVYKVSFLLEPPITSRGL